jgi:hypothetical protein
VETVLRQLNFSEEDMRTRIGSVEERGLSGGQRFVFSQTPISPI